ncbi:MAG TPA: multidrug ABC transporter ATP-binding protein, partial [Lactobacillus sp.]|nr:multidrug ABC transporter ATP-binding protein [Lactobacillus sp.]
VQASFDRLMADRTSLVIAHRLSTVRHADKILVLEHGQIVEAGNHEQLMAQNGRYKELYDLQF